jgi:hypothetical protein
MAFEQRCAERLLDFVEEFRRRWLRQIQAFRGAVQAEGFLKGDHQREMAQLDSRKQVEERVRMHRRSGNGRVPYGLWPFKRTPSKMSTPIPRMAGRSGR